MITRLYFKNFRSLNEEALCFENQVVFFTGKNNQGKTSILESLYILGSGSYLIEKESDHFINTLKDQALIACEWKEKEIEHQLYLRFEKKNKVNVTFDKKIIKKKNILKRFLCIQYLSAEINQAFQGSPNQRRQFFNHFFSAFDPDYSNLLKIYTQYLIKKNKLLKKENIDKNSYEFLNQQLIKTAVDLVEKRISLLVKFQNYFKNKKDYLICNHFDSISFTYQCSRLEPFKYFNRQRYAEILRNKIKDDEMKERVLGYALVGPHKDDYDVIFQNKSLFRFASRGINRVFAIAMYGETMKWVSKKNNQKLCLLADDIFSELDQERQRWVADYLSNLGQLFLAGVSQQELNLFSAPQHFEVSNGAISAAT